MKSTIQSGDLNQYDLCSAGFVVTGLAESLFNRQRNNNGFKLFVEPALDCRNPVAHGRKAGIDSATYATFYQNVSNVSRGARKWLLPSLGVARANAIQQTFETSRNKLPETRTDRDALLRDKKQLLQSLDNLLSVVARLENLAQLDVALSRWNDVVLLGHDNDVCVRNIIFYFYFILLYFILFVMKGIVETSSEKFERRRNHEGCISRTRARR